jgi:hypothetical protein
MNIVLWILQVLLGGLFGFAGVMKFVMPVAMMTKGTGLTGAFIHFIGVAEVAGALGLILPSLLKIRPSLTPLAAALLVPIMVGAVVITLKTMPPSNAVMPAVCGVLLLFVAWGRWKAAPIQPKA